ncbi:MAG: vanadium-dependent haloperoxidase, partial [Bacteroidota bacterium]
EEKHPQKLMSFTKGLEHDPDTGLLVREDDYDAFMQGIETGDPNDFKSTPLGPPINSEGNPTWTSRKGIERNVDVRAWESAGAGLTFDLEGPDAQAVTMPPAPALGSDELTCELAEVYCQALLRDIPLSVFFENAPSDPADEAKVQECLDAMNQLPFSGERENIISATAFRGFTPGDSLGPYLSQFMLAGNNGLSQSGGAMEFKASDGYINYGSITIDQRVRRASETNYMTTWDDYLDVQNGADFRGLEEYVSNERRFITTGRDLATYVHYDALYEAYLNACLLLLGMGLEGSDPMTSRFDNGVPFQKRDFFDKQQGFAHYGGPHILTLVTEVATRALKAVRYQKFNIHRRLRPEALAARMEKLNDIIATHAWPERDSLINMHGSLNSAGIFDLLRNENDGNLLLPMAFCEGSPMHPSYGAGHATVAGACVTILKAFFNHELYLNLSKDGSTMTLSDQPGEYAFVPEDQGNSLLTVESAPLTVEGELNKLAANISIGRNWAGVHYYSDYVESLILGEEIAICLLKEQAITYNPLEGFFMTVPKFDGTVEVINGVTPHAPLSILS